MMSRCPLTLGHCLGLGACGGVKCRPPGESAGEKNATVPRARYRVRFFSGCGLRPLM